MKSENAKHLRQTRLRRWPSQGQQFEVIRRPRTNLSCYVAISFLPHLKANHPEKCWDFVFTVQLSKQGEVIVPRCIEEEALSTMFQVVLIGGSSVVVILSPHAHVQDDVALIVGGGIAFATICSNP